MEPDMSNLKPNVGKELIINTDFGQFVRYPVKTHVIMKGDNLKEVLDKYVKPYLCDGDSIFMSEKIVAISQGRAWDIDEIVPSKWAKLLVKFVTKSPYGIGLGSVYTMELAIRDIGLPKILLGCFCAAVTKPFGIKGVFYNVVGPKARAIDGPCDCTIPPYNHYAKLCPEKPNKVAKELSQHIGHPVVIMDTNDLGVQILGNSCKDITLKMARQMFRDNPLDQSDQQTPIAIARKVED